MFSPDDNVEMKITHLTHDLLNYFYDEDKNIKDVLIEKDRKANPYYQSVLDFRLNLMKPEKTAAAKPQAPVTRFIQLPHISQDDI